MRSDRLRDESAAGQSGLGRDVGDERAGLARGRGPQERDLGGPVGVVREQGVALVGQPVDDDHELLAALPVAQHDEPFLH